MAGYWKIEKEWVNVWGLTGNEALLLADIVDWPKATIEQRADRVNMTGRTVINITNRFRDNEKISPLLGEKISPNTVKNFHHDSEKISPKRVKKFHQNSEKFSPPPTPPYIEEQEEQEEEQGESARARKIILSGIVDFYEKNIHATYIPDFRVETTAARELAEKIKIAMSAENWIPTADSVRTFWLDFLSAAYQVADTWQRNHFDIRTLNSQFNNFYLKIKNGNQPDNGSANNGTSRDTLERKIREAAGIV